MIATAVAARLEYGAAWAALKEQKRRSRSRTSNKKVKLALEKFGYKLTPVDPDHFWAKYPERKEEVNGIQVFYGGQITTNHLVRFPQAWEDANTYLLWTANHVLAVQYGQIHDWSMNNQLRVKRIDIVERI